MEKGKRKAKKGKAKKGGVVRSSALAWNAGFSAETRETLRAETVPQQPRAAVASAERGSRAAHPPNAMDLQKHIAPDFPRSGLAQALTKATTHLEQEPPLPMRRAESAPAAAPPPPLPEFPLRQASSEGDAGNVAMNAAEEWPPADDFGGDKSLLPVAAIAQQQQQQYQQATHGFLATQQQRAGEEEQMLELALDVPSVYQRHNQNGSSAVFVQVQPQISSTAELPFARTVLQRGVSEPPLSPKQPVQGQKVPFDRRRRSSVGVMRTGSTRTGSPEMKRSPATSQTQLDELGAGSGGAASVSASSSSSSSAVTEDPAVAKIRAEEEANRLRRIAEKSALLGEQQLGEEGAGITYERRQRGSGLKKEVQPEHDDPVARIFDLRKKRQALEESPGSDAYLSDDESASSGASDRYNSFVRGIGKDKPYEAKSKLKPSQQQAQPSINEQSEREREEEERTAAARDFYHELLATGKRPLARAKLMVVGSGYAGKTSLINRLVGRPFQAEQTSTCGIEIDEVAWRPGVPNVEPQTDVEDAANGAVSGGGDKTGGAGFLDAMLEAMVEKLRVQAECKVRAALAPPPQPPTLQRATSSGASPLDLDLAPNPVFRITTEADRSEMERLAAMAATVGDYNGGAGTDATDSMSAVEPVLTILDFAGQRMYYQMHHVFITNSLSIYVAVFNLAHDPEEALGGEDAECGATRLENLHFWLNSIHAQAPDAPIFVVGTHRESVDAVTLNERTSQIEQSFDGQAFDGQLCANSEIVCVDNKCDGDALFEKLRTLLAAETKAILAQFNIEIGGEDFGSDVPLRWLKCLDSLNSRSGAAARLSLEETGIVARTCGVGQDEHAFLDRELLLFLRVFTSAGLLMHFNEHGLRDLVVLQPQWLLNAMRDVLCSRTIDARRKSARGAAKKALRALRDCGRLDVNAVLPLLWPALPPAERKALMAYLVRFDLCVPLKHMELALPRMTTMSSGAQPRIESGDNDDARTTGGGDTKAAATQQLLAAVPALFPPADAGRTHWEPRDDDLIAYFCCAHRASSESGSGSLPESCAFDARNAYDDECRYLPRTLFHTLVARLLGAGNTVGSRTAFGRLHAERAVLQQPPVLLRQQQRMTTTSATKWLLLELCSSECEIKLTVRAETANTNSGAAALLDHLLSNYWPALKTKYGVQMRVELEPHPSAASEETTLSLSSGGRVDLGTGCVIATREPAPLLCAPWQQPPSGSATVAVAMAEEEEVLKEEATEKENAELEHTTTNKMMRDEADFDERQRVGPWCFFLSHMQTTAGDAVACLHFGLERLGCTSWYDNEASDLTATGMANGVRNSSVFLLFLTKGVLSRPYVRFELLVAIQAQKPIVLVHEENKSKHPFDFDATTGVSPGEMQLVTTKLLAQFQSLPYRRLKHERRGFLEEIMRRRDANELKTFQQACGAEVDEAAIAAAMAQTRRDLDRAKLEVDAAAAALKAAAAEGFTNKSPGSETLVTTPPPPLAVITPKKDGCCTMC